MADLINLAEVFAQVSAREELARAKIGTYPAEAVADATAVMVECYKEHPSSVLGLELIVKLLNDNHCQ